MRCVCASLAFWTVALGAVAHAAPPAPASALEVVTLGGTIDRDTDDTPAFTPDGNTVFFDRSLGAAKTIMISRRAGGRWIAPKAASFSGTWFDQNPVVAPDGSYVLFDSNRPREAGGKALVQRYFHGAAGPGSNIWRVDRKGDAWDKPRWLGPLVNDDLFIDFPSIASDGTLYFMRIDHRARILRFRRAPYRAGGYLRPEPVSLGGADITEHDPAIARDQSFIVFDYGRVKGGLGRLCIAFREGDRWGAPIDLGNAINRNKPWGAHLSPDGRTVYVTGDAGIERFSLAPWLARRGRKPGA